MNVITTDYDSYSIVHSCKLFLGFKKMEFMWVLTRKALEKGSSDFIAMDYKIKGIIIDKF